MKFVAYHILILLTFQSFANTTPTYTIRGKLGQVKYRIYCRKSPTSKKMESKIDSLFSSIDQQLRSDHKASSTAAFNKNGAVISNGLFSSIFHQTYDVFANTKGAYNPTDIAYDNYWKAHDLRHPTAEDSNAIDTLYKYNVFSGFVEYDSLPENTKDSFHLIATEDFAFALGYDDLLAGIKADALLAYLQTMQDVQPISFSIVDQAMYHRNTLQITWDSIHPAVFNLQMKNCNYDADLHGHLYKCDPKKTFQLQSRSALEGACYIIAIRKTKNNNNAQFWKGLVTVN